MYGCIDSGLDEILLNREYLSGCLFANMAKISKKLYFNFGQTISTYMIAHFISYRNLDVNISNSIIWNY